MEYWDARFSPMNMAYRGWEVALMLPAMVNHDRVFAKGQ